MSEFSGAKIALLHGENVLSILRDNKPDIPYPNMWDVPGGAREGNELPRECALREVDEELSVAIDPQQIVWEREYPLKDNSRRTNVFLVAHITSKQIEAVKFGREGQRWQMMPINDFMTGTQVVGAIQRRLGQYLATNTLNHSESKNG